jgi:hypothetical protein
MPLFLAGKPRGAAAGLFFALTLFGLHPDMADLGSTKAAAFSQPRT